MACNRCGGYGDCWVNKSVDHDRPSYDLVPCGYCRGGDEIPRERHQGNAELAMEKAVQAIEKQYRKYAGSV